MSKLPASFVAAVRAVNRIVNQVAAEEGFTPDIVPASTWLGAVLLDAAGLDPQSLLQGTACIVTGTSALVGPVAAAIRAAVPQCVEHGRDHKPGPCHPVVAEDGLGLPEWYAAALRKGAPVVAVTATGDGMAPQEAVILAGREIEIPPVPRGWAIAATVEAATGNRIYVRDEDAAVLTWDDLVLVVQPGDDHILAAERIRRLARSRRERPAKGPGTRTKGAAASPAAAPPAGDGVVRRLADMPGFGPEARAWGLALAADLQAYRAGTLPWRDVDRGILLSGPPGCGKTTFARALAMECEVELVTSLYSEWSEASSGDAVSKTLTKLFKTWREKAKGGAFILFLDEIDSMGARGGNGQGEHWFRPIINTWLAFLDGAEPREGIVVVGATNNVAGVDPALCRPGRLDRHVVMPAPGGDALAGVLRAHLGTEADLDGLDAAARACRGMSSAQIGLVVRDARRLARTTFKRAVSADDVRLVLDTLRLQSGVSPVTERVVAVHEAGHAVAMLHSRVVDLEHVDLDRSYTRSTRPAVETLAVIEGRLDILLAGMTAEQVLLGRHSAGCEQDLREATTVATHAHGRWGMGRGLRALTVDEMLADAAVTGAVDGMLGAAHRRVTALVEANRDAVDRLADALVRQRYLDADEVRAVVAGVAPDREAVR